ncbi:MULTISPECIES: SDR family NAD(P)-dependent oxidoreductase [unclassified Rhodococcus (in: high G+C Gram-positive bacteria)]|uniref:SDR family NAD(P)-dependent oxidoreductase n=1 Tax=unclassified Rhodococcus (in: high G+C Gram-positive bacteria) TaxID=192944 RepID=UPI0006F9CF42|nr:MULTISPECIES: SDR family NAD(P)-dependent oxidoreductase [unclassified Rhodococcus (in: high G+C Gram-positive bacteria)]KQU28529.1 short-chain dehydrogenase [Rhodococcus sp. Leaf225]KQU44422.1 short-chain dehydrogenase [Rhodococcus sp. Leaf258]
MSRVLITGSTDGVGRAAAVSLLDDGHEVVVHARTRQRLSAVEDLTTRGASAVVGDLAHLDQVQSIAEQAHHIGAVDAVIHNAGIIDGPSLLPVNVVAPYVLSALMGSPERLIYLSSSMHRGGDRNLARADFSGTRKTVSYSDSKLFVTTLMAAVARRCTSVLAHAVDPGWVPTKMGGPSASDDLALGHVTQAWLATTDDPEALVSGGYWHHEQTETPHPAVHDDDFQDQLVAALTEHTGISLHHR